MQPILPVRARALAAHPRAWQAARARALVLPRGRSVLVSAAEHALGRELIRPHVSLYSPNACVSKLTCFIGERGRTAPTVVVKAMARSEDGWWLQAEVEKLREVRLRLSGATRAALLPPPLFAGELEDEYLVVERYESFSSWCENSSRAPARAHAWLREFQRTTRRAPSRWGDPDTTAALETIRDAWDLLRPAGAARAIGSASALLGGLHGVELPRCAIHGDFSPGNLAEVGEQLKVLDWEWSSLDGAPSFDLWSFQLAIVHRQIARGVAQVDELMDSALRFVEEQLDMVGAERALALATLPVVLGDLVLRVRRTLAQVGPWECSSASLMAAVERLSARHAAHPG